MSSSLPSFACPAAIDNYIIFGFFAILGVAGVILMLFIVPMKSRKVSRLGDAVVLDPHHTYVYHLLTGFTSGIPQ